MRRRILTVSLMLCTAMLTVTAQTGNLSVWTLSTVPTTPDGGPDSAVELGVKFKSDVNGKVIGIRFYKSAANTGTHVANLWTTGKTKLASATFANETASGWQQVNFATPVAITAGTVYVASYHTNVGHYAADQNYFATTGVDAPPLHLLKNSASGVNGVYAYGSTSKYPSSGWNASNYWVDVVFSPATSASPTITSVSPANGSTGVSVSASITATFSQAMNAATINATTLQLLDGSTAVPATVSYNSSTLTATLQPLAALAASKTFTATVSGGSSGVKDINGNAMAANYTWSFTTAAAPPPISITAVSLNPASVIGGTPSTGTITLSAAAPSGGIAVNLTSSNTSAATVPASVTVPSGSSTANFTVTTMAVTTASLSTITATYGTTSSDAIFAVNPASTSGIPPAGWYAGDMHAHRSCGGSPESVSSIFSKMSTNNISVLSLLADMGNGEVQNPTTDLPLVTGQDASISTPGQILHWDAEWHWDPTYTQYPHQVLGGHLLALGVADAYQLWDEYTYPVINWAHQQGGIAGFAHMEYLDDGIPQSLTCCTPIEYPVEVALGSADFISEDVAVSDYATHAYYRLLNTGFRPGFAGGTDYPCGVSVPGAIVTFVQVANGQLTYRNWVDGIAKGRTVVSGNGTNEFLDLKVNGTATPGDEIQLATSGTITVQVTWTSKKAVTGTLELVSNGSVVASKTATLAAGDSTTLTATINFSQSGWLAARRMGSIAGGSGGFPTPPAGGHVVHTAAVFVTVTGKPVRASAADAQFYVNWMDQLLQNTSPGGPWNKYFPTSLSLAQARYQSAKAIFQQIAAEAGGNPPPLPPPPPSGSQTIFTTQAPTMFEADSFYELGTRFWADVAGQITGVRLYTNSIEGGNHTVRIWKGSGTLLAGPFTWNIAPGTSGWKTFTLPTAVSIPANTDYIVAISNSSDKYYAEQNHGFDTAIVNGNLHTYVGSGVWTSTSGAMPTLTWQNTNYFRDVVFVAQ
jgi:hypothetical protein